MGSLQIENKNYKNNAVELENTKNTLNILNSKLNSLETEKNDLKKQADELADAKKILENTVRETEIKKEQEIDILNQKMTNKDQNNEKEHNSLKSELKSLQIENKN